MENRFETTMIIDFDCSLREIILSPPGGVLPTITMGLWVWALHRGLPL